MIVSRTIEPTLVSVSPLGDATPPVGKSPGAVAVVSIGPLGAGDGTPLVGKSPARADTESTQAKAIAAKKRFMLFLLWQLRIQEFLHNLSISQFSEVLASPTLRT